MNKNKNKKVFLKAVGITAAVLSVVGAVLVIFLKRKSNAIGE